MSLIPEQLSGYDLTYKTLTKPALETITSASEFPRSGYMQDCFNYTLPLLTILLFLSSLYSSSSPHHTPPPLLIILLLLSSPYSSSSPHHTPPPLLTILLLLSSPYSSTSPHLTSCDAVSAPLNVLTSRQRLTLIFWKTYTVNNSYYGIPNELSRPRKTRAFNGLTNGAPKMYILGPKY